MKKFILLLSAVILYTSCSKNEVWENEIDTIFTERFSDSTPGGAVLILKGEKIVFSKGYGLADLTSKERITETTLFNTGSISKTFVSNVILDLARDGKLSLDDSLSRYFNDFKVKSVSDKVKLHHLLTHTSGLPDNRRQHLDSVELLTAKDQENFDPIKLNDSLNFEPGAQYEYSNPAFNGLALIIEKVTGRKWQEVVKERIFMPCNMPTSVITDGDFPQQGVAHAYLKKGNDFVEKDYGEEPTFAAAGNGGVWSSVKELANYELALRKAKILNDEIIENSRTIKIYPNWRAVEKPFIGYSWFVGTTENDSKIISHTGTQGGFYGDYVSIPDKGITYIMLCNQPVDQLQIRERVIAILQRNNWLIK